VTGAGVRTALATVALGGIVAATVFVAGLPQVEELQRPRLDVSPSPPAHDPYEVVDGVILDDGDLPPASAGSVAPGGVDTVGGAARSGLPPGGGGVEVGLGDGSGGAGGLAGPPPLPLPGAAPTVGLRPGRTSPLPSPPPGVVEPSDPDDPERPGPDPGAPSPVLPTSPSPAPGASPGPAPEPPTTSPVPPGTPSDPGHVVAPVLSPARPDAGGGTPVAGSPAGKPGTAGKPGSVGRPDWVEPPGARRQDGAGRPALGARNNEAAAGPPGSRREEVGPPAPGARNEEAPGQQRRADSGGPDGAQGQHGGDD
jgi:hypothetical protein